MGSRPDPSAPERVTAVVFDLDGVLADSFEVWVAVLAQCRAARGLPRLEKREIRACWGQGIAADCETLFPGAEPAELAREYDSRFETNLHELKEIEGASALVEFLAARSVGLAVASNSPVPVVRAVLARLGLESFFSAVCGGDETERGKPDPALVELALTRLGRDRGEAIMVGDTELDVRAARSAGVFAVGYRVPADLTVDDLSQLVPWLDARTGVRLPG